MRQYAVEDTQASAKSNTNVSTNTNTNWIHSKMNHKTRQGGWWEQFTVRIAAIYRHFRMRIALRWFLRHLSCDFRFPCTSFRTTNSIKLQGTTMASLYVLGLGYLLSKTFSGRWVFGQNSNKLPGTILVFMLVRCPKNFANKSGANKKCKIIWVNSEWLLQTQTQPQSRSRSLSRPRSPCRVYAYLSCLYPHSPRAPRKRGETLCNVTFRIFSFDFKFAKLVRCQLSWKYCKLRQSHVQVYRHLALPARQPQRGANARVQLTTAALPTSLPLPLPT